MAEPSPARPARRLLLFGVVGSLSLTALIAIVVLLTGDFDETDARILLTTGSLSIYGLLSLPGAVLLDQRRLDALGWLVVALAVVGFVLAMNLVWLQWHDAGHASWKSVVVVTAFGAALAQIAASQSRRRLGDPLAVVRLSQLTAVAALVLAALVSVAALAEIDDENYYRALGAVAVLAVLLHVLQPIWRRLGGERAARGRFRLVCVVDRPPQPLPAGYRPRNGDATEIECELDERDFAAAAAAAIRQLERSRSDVVRLERLEP